jgi:hypothetical protein
VKVGRDVAETRRWCRAENLAQVAQASSDPTTHHSVYAHFASPQIGFDWMIVDLFASEERNIARQPVEVRSVVSVRISRPDPCNKELATRICGFADDAVLSFRNEMMALALRRRSRCTMSTAVPPTCRWIWSGKGAL